MSTASRALVLGGGGVTGIAWMTGLLLGLEEAGVEARAVDHIIGTSAGSVVGVQILCGVPLSELFERQIDPERQVAELDPGADRWRLLAALAPAMFGRGDAREKRRRVGRVALRGGTVDPARRRAVIAERLPEQTWPEASLGIVAVDAESGEDRCFDRDSGVNLVDAVAASCAVPGLWPPVRIDGRDYMDGGVPSPENLTHASGFASVLVLAPMGAARPGRLRGRLRDEVAALETEGSRVSVVVPDAEAARAMGRDPLDRTRRAEAARAGRRQGREITPPEALASDPS